MASPLFLAQQIFSQLLKSTGSQSTDPTAYQSTNCTPMGTTANATVPQSALPIPQDLPSLVTFFFSTSAAMEWLKILVYGSLLEMLRRLVFYVYRRGYDSFFITATFKEDDLSYSWVCYWLSRQPAWSHARDLEVSTDAFGFDEAEENGRSASHRGQHLAYLPSEDTVHTIWYKGHWMRVTRLCKEGSYGRKCSYIELCILARSHSILNTILLDSKKEYQEAKKNVISVYVPNRQSWRVLGTRSKRAFSSIILDPGMKDLLINDAKDFLSSKPWYGARGIPFRRGYLLYGAPGSGKTSIIHSIAGELGLDVYIVSLSKSGMDDTALNELITDLPETCIALMEDIDAAFSQTINRESNSAHNGDDDDEGKENVEKPATQVNLSYRPTSTITLSGLLNALDGVGAQEGRILFATTNKYESLDPALCRPGRMDIHMEFKLASRHQARELFKCFYMPDSDPKEEDREEKEKSDGDSGYSTSSDDEKEQELGIRVQETLVSGTKVNGSSCEAERTLPLTIPEVEKLADEFADAIPEREFSMASLQGYLMGYKILPVTAVKNAAMWVTKEREERQRVKERSKDQKLNNGASAQV